MIKKSNNIFNKKIFREQSLRQVVVRMGGGAKISVQLKWRGKISVHEFRWGGGRTIILSEHDFQNCTAPPHAINRPNDCFLACHV